MVIGVNQIYCSQELFKNAPKFEYPDNNKKNKKKQRMVQRALIDG